MFETGLKGLLGTSLLAGTFAGLGLPGLGMAVTASNTMETTREMIHGQDEPRPGMFEPPTPKGPMDF